MVGIITAIPTYTILKTYITCNFFRSNYTKRKPQNRADHRKNTLKLSFDIKLGDKFEQTKTMWAFQLHFVVDNLFEFAAQIPSGPAISPNNDPYDPGIT